MGQREDIAAKAYSQIGNGPSKYWSWAGTSGIAWCALFVCWCANQVGVSTSIIPKNYSCSSLVSTFKTKGVWKGKSGYTPKKGDLIFYETNNPSDGADHIGIVYSCSGSNIITVEGNWGNQVSKRSLTLSNSTILGYASPAYTGGSTPPTTTKKNSVGQTGPNPDTTKYPSTVNAWVKKVQALMNEKYSLNTPVDGIPGPRLYNCLKTNYVIYLNSDYGPMTKLTQERLSLLGYYSGVVDGVVGPLTKAAANKFQTTYGLPPSDVKGVTWYYLLAP